MATCKNCGANIPEGSQFCVECGTPVASEKKTKKGLFKSKKDKKAENEAPASGFKDTGADVVPEPDYESIEAEAKDWASDIGTEEEQPVISPDDMDLSHAPDKHIVPTAVFIPRSKNNFADKSFGLLIFMIIAAIVVIGFVFSPGLLNPVSLRAALIEFSPLLLLSLAMLISVRTGNFDLSIPAIAVVTYFVLMSGFNQMNFYSMLILCFGGAVCIGLFTGLLTAIAKIPSVFTGLVITALSFVYLDTVFSVSGEFAPTAYTAFSEQYLPISLLILSAVAVFVLIYLTKLGKPLYKRKGLTASNKLLYVLSFALASALAAASGTIASIIGPAFTADIAGASGMMMNYTLGLIFIMAAAGCSTLFDNRVMPVLMVIIGFLVWFGIDVIIGQTVLVTRGVLVASAAKAGFVLLALIGERVYTKAHLADFYQTINVKK